MIFLQPTGSSVAEGEAARYPEGSGGPGRILAKKGHGQVNRILVGGFGWT